MTSKNSKRHYNSLKPKLWRDKKFMAMSDQARLLYLWYLTNAEVDSSGCYLMQDAIAAVHMHWDIDTLIVAKKELIDAGMIVFDDETDEVWPVDWFEHNPITGPKLAIGTIRLIRDIESVWIRKAAIKAAATQPQAKQAISENFPVEEMAADAGLYEEVGHDDLRKTG